MSFNFEGWKAAVCAAANELAEPDDFLEACGFFGHDGGMDDLFSNDRSSSMARTSHSDQLIEAAGLTEPVDSAAEFEAFFRRSKLTLIGPTSTRTNSQRDDLASEPPQ